MPQPTGVRYFLTWHNQGGSESARGLAQSKTLRDHQDRRGGASFWTAPVLWRFLTGCGGAKPIGHSPPNPLFLSLLQSPGSAKLLYNFSVHTFHPCASILFVMKHLLTLSILAFTVAGSSA